MIRRLSLLAALVAIASLVVCADEITLKDGSKIDGAIVGFQGNSFRVKTSYGFAVVRKDEIVSIRVVNAGKPAAKDAADPKKDDAAEKSARADTGRSNSAALERATTAPSVSSTKAAAVAPAAESPTTQLASAQRAGHSPEMANAASPATAAPPTVPAAPAVIRERVDGNTYINDTYGFSMYKPPDWNLIAGARTLLPGAITALGTDDQTTYLLIGQDAAQKSIESQMQATVSRLAGIMDKFQPLGEARVNISGMPAIERRFRGSVDQHDWSGVVVVIPRGPIVFMIFGMTYAETDLVQIQENVIARTIASIQFAQN